MMRAGRSRVALTALLVASSLALAGCGSDDGGPASTKPAGKEKTDGENAGDGKKAPEKDAPEGVAPGEKNPNGTPAKLQFTSRTIDGKAFKGASLADKPAVLWFWAPWCGTCQGQAAQTAKLAEKYKGKVNFIGVAGLDKTEPIKGFVKTQKVGNFPHLNDQKGAVWKKFGITQQSSYVMLDKNGKAVEQEAATTPGQLTEQVARLAG
ncbi:redoxin family protein [Streptomyces sp. WMMB 322]|uniref:redoxin family protein n=1 Tax=Streptomyces sp. WMMB 322 TaxID=1286821 RepID=UPI0006E2A3D7|nr:redoxin family protein [Streptomyces sp. WMMB 322]SCK36155.1 Thiol-disulfide isomerase or thioredoxin [Streptomyces sp. WMMB 322]